MNEMGLQRRDQLVDVQGCRMENIAKAYQKCRGSSGHWLLAMVNLREFRDVVGHFVQLLAAASRQNEPLVLAFTDTHGVHPSPAVVTLLAAALR